MNRIENLLVIASEEAHEVSMAANMIGQVASKALRFGLDSTFNGKLTSNRDSLVLEFNHLIAAIEMLEEEGISLPGLYDRTMIDEKKKKVKSLMTV